MAVREFTYTVGKNDIAAANIPQAGVQGEHNATKVIFKIAEDLKTELSSLSGDGKTFCYHFDRYDGTGGKNSTEPIRFNPDIDTEFSHLIEQWQTRYGGAIQVFFVITLIENDKTELELYSYCVKMQLKSLPEAAEVDEENYDTIVTLAMVAKKHSEIATNAAIDATNAAQRTELAKAELQGGSEWVFDGGSASDAIGIDFVVDSEVINDSDNPVKSKAIKAYVDEKTNALAAENEEQEKVINENATVLGKMVDYIVEQDTVGNWTYRKWNSGVAECWCVIPTTINELVRGDDYHFFQAISDYKFPEVNGQPLFIAVPKLDVDIGNAPTTGLGQGILYSLRGYQTITNTGTLYVAGTSKYIDGFELSYTREDGLKVYKLEKGMKVIISIAAKGIWK